MFFEGLKNVQTVEIEAIEIVSFITLKLIQMCAERKDVKECKLRFFFLQILSHIQRYRACFDFIKPVLFTTNITVVTAKVLTPRKKHCCLHTSAPSLPVFHSACLHTI